MPKYNMQPHAAACFFRDYGTLGPVQFAAGPSYGAQVSGRGLSDAAPGRRGGRPPRSLVFQFCVLLYFLYSFFSFHIMLYGGYT